MKLKKIVILIFLLYGWISYCQCQKIDTIYYEKDWKVTSSKSYKYYRVATQEKEIVKVVDYYRSGNIQMTGGFKTFDFKDKTGLFFYYDKKMRITGFDLYESSRYPEFQAELINARLNIPLKSDSLILFGSNFKNGNIHSLGYGKDNCYRQGTWLFFYQNGSIEAKESYLNNRLDGECIYYHYNGLIYLHGDYKDNKKEGVWEYYRYSGKLMMTTYYSNGEVIKIIR